MSNSSKLQDHLYPRGRSAAEPELLPRVKDSDGNDIPFGSLKRITNTSTAVDIGTAPNNNTGDPLRTAFIKINNFIEASYWTNDGVNTKIDNIYILGPFLGVLTYTQLQEKNNLLQAQKNENNIITGNIAVLADDIIFKARNDKDTILIEDSTVQSIRGNIVLPKGSIVQYDVNAVTTVSNVTYNGRFKPVYINSSENNSFNFNRALSRLQTGNADTALSAEEQSKLYEQFINTGAGQSKNEYIQARNVEDAITEMFTRFSRRGFDAGYYG